MSIHLEGFKKLRSEIFKQAQEENMKIVMKLVRNSEYSKSDDVKTFPTLVTRLSKIVDSVIFLESLAPPVETFSLAQMLSFL